MSTTPTNGKPRSNLRPEVLRELIANATMGRMQFLSKFLDPRRSIEDECGYPDSALMGPDTYRDLYDRDPIANRAIQLMAREAWKATPLVYELENSDEPTEFEQAWDEVGQSLRGEMCFYKDEKGSPIWDPVKRAHAIAGICHFGLLLIGIDDGRGLDQPADGVVSLSPTGNTMTLTANGERRTFPTRPSKELDRAPTYARDDNRWKIPLVNGSRKFSEDAGDDPVGGSITANFIASSVDQLYDGTGIESQYTGTPLGPSEYPSKKPSKKRRKLLYLRPFDESLVQIVQYEADPRNPRFGMPVMYRITLNDPRLQTSGVGLSLATVRVHWSRVIHIARTAENPQASEIFAPPILQPILNRILDLRKVYGGDAEAFWKNCLMKLLLNTPQEWGMDVDVDMDDLRDQMENLGNGLQPWVALMGLQAQVVAPAVVDPTAHIAIQIEAICIQLDCPVPVFKGYEIGEQASENNDSDWNDRVDGYRNSFTTPRVIIPLVDRLISMGVLPEPKATDKSVPIVNANGKVIGVKTKTGYCVEWPAIDIMSEADKATVAATKTTALAGYVSGSVEQIMPPQDYLTRIMGFDEEEAAAILDSAEQHMEEQHQTELDQQKEAIDAGVQPDPNAKPPVGPHTLNPGQIAVHPETGKVIAKGNPLPTANEVLSLNARVREARARVERLRQTVNVFCPTGQGGGVDPSCGKDGGGASSSSEPSPGKGSEGQRAALSERASGIIGKHQTEADARGNAAVSKLIDSSSTLKGKVSEHEIHQKLKEALDKAEITVNFDPHHASASAIMQSGQLKNAFEAAGARSKDYLGTRTNNEQSVLGIGKDTSSGDRPVYAAVNWQKGMFGAASKYGTASIVLNKDHLAGRTTLAPKDSFGLRDSSHIGTLEKPSAALANNHLALAAAGFKDHGASHVENSYTEAHIHGGNLPLNRDTVKEIRLPMSAVTSQHAQSIKAFTDKAGIPLRVFHDQTGQTVDFHQAREVQMKAEKQEKGKGMFGGIKKLFGLSGNALVSNEGAMVVMATSPGNVVIRKGDGLFLRRLYSPDEPMDLIVKDVDESIKLELSKGDFVPVIGARGEPNPPIGDNEFPILEETENGFRMTGSQPKRSLAAI